MLEKYFRGAVAGRRARCAMINLISDLTARDFGGYHAVLAVHAEGSIEAEKMQILRAYDAAPAPSPTPASWPGSTDRSSWPVIAAPWRRDQGPVRATGVVRS